MAQKNRDPSEIKTTSRVFEIVEFLMDQDGATLTEVVEGLDIVKSTAYRHLKSLENEEYIVREGNTYYPGMQFLNIGKSVQNRKEVYRLAKPKVDQLAEQTEERSEFMIEEYDRAIFVQRAVGSNAVDVNTRVGKSLPIYATAPGKAILSGYSHERVEEMIERLELEQLTDNTITDPDELMANIEETRERGVAYNDQELVPGLRSIGVPISQQDGEVYGALSITGPTSRLQGDLWQEKYPDLLLGVANELELNLTY